MELYDPCRRLVDLPVGANRKSRKKIHKLRSRKAKHAPRQIDFDKKSSRADNQA
jgi:hypothetical protein